MVDLFEPREGGDTQPAELAGIDKPDHLVGYFEHLGLHLRFAYVALGQAAIA